jgi:hypothetical protein
MIEKFTQNCSRCNKPIELEWENGLLPGNYVLIADWVYHPECWDELIALHPPSEFFSLGDDFETK